MNWEEQMNAAVGSWDDVPIDLVEVDLNVHAVGGADCCSNDHWMDADAVVVVADFVMNEGHSILRFKVWSKKKRVSLLEHLVIVLITLH